MYVDMVAIRQFRKKGDTYIHGVEITYINVLDTRMYLDLKKIMMRTLAYEHWAYPNYLRSWVRIPQSF
jgi:hypothetical protein